MKQHPKDKIWLIKADRVCTDCWKKYLKANPDEAKKIDKNFKEKLDHVNDFIDWVKREEVRWHNTPRENFVQKEDSITCNLCTKVMMVWHICYNKHLEPVSHKIDDKEVCHFCWDNFLKGQSGMLKTVC